MGIINTINSVLRASKLSIGLALLFLMQGCSNIPLPLSVPLAPSISYMSIECFFEDNNNKHNKLTPLEFIRHSLVGGNSKLNKSCSKRKPYLVPGLKISPGFELTITALDAGQGLERSANLRHSQATVPHQVTLPVRFVAPSDKGGHLTSLEQGILLSALTTHRARCFSGKKTDCTKAQAKKVRTYFDENAIYLWNALVREARLISIDRHLYADGAITFKELKQSNWGLFISFRAMCERLPKNERKTFASFFRNSTNKKPCAAIDKKYKHIPRYMVNAPSAMLLSAFVSDDYEKLGVKEGFFADRRTMGRNSTVVAVPFVVTPAEPGSAKNWTLADWEYSGVCGGLDSKKQSHFIIHSLRVKQSLTYIKIHRLPLEDDIKNKKSKLESSHTVIDIVSNRDNDVGTTRKRSIQARQSFYFIPSIHYLDLKKLYPSDLISLTWKLRVKSGKVSKANLDQPDLAPGCDFSSRSRGQ